LNENEIMSRYHAINRPKDTVISTFAELLFNDSTNNDLVVRMIYDTHYLGKAKRRLFAFKSDSPLSIGDILHCAESKSAKASGSVVSRVKFGADFYCLATLEVENKDNKITINNDQGPTLIRIHNE